MGGQKETVKATENRDPWAPSQPFLLKGLNEASTIYDQQKAANNPGYTGDFVAQPNQTQINGANTFMNFGNDAGMNQATANMGAGNLLVGGGASNIMNSMSGLNSFAGSNLTGNNISAAGQYANNAFMDGMVQAATRDASRQFNETTMPGIDMGAAATGNFNSTRAGVAAGIAQRGLQDTIADTSSQLRGAAYQQGITQASNDQAQKLQATTTAGQLGNSLMAGGNSLIGLGWDGATKSADMFNIGNALTSANNQAAIDNNLARLEYKTTQPWQNLNNAYNIFSNAGQQGGTTVSNSTKTTTASPLSTFGSLLGVAGSFMRCDERVKNVVGRIGTLDNGLPVYLFTYRDDPTATPVIGPMAQDVEAVTPEAVIEVDGVKHIDTTILFKSLDKKGATH